MVPRGSCIFGSTHMDIHAGILMDIHIDGMLTSMWSSIWMSTVDALGTTADRGCGRLRRPPGVKPLWAFLPPLWTSDASSSCPERMQTAPLSAAVPKASIVEIQMDVEMNIHMDIHMEDRIDVHMGVQWTSIC